MPCTFTYFVLCLQVVNLSSHSAAYYLCKLLIYQALALITQLIISITDFLTEFPSLNQYNRNLPQNINIYIHIYKDFIKETSHSKTYKNIILSKDKLSHTLSINPGKHDLTIDKGKDRLLILENEQILKICIYFVYKLTTSYIGNM